MASPALPSAAHHPFHLPNDGKLQFELRFLDWLDRRAVAEKGQELRFAIDNKISKADISDLAPSSFLRS